MISMSIFIALAVFSVVLLFLITKAEEQLPGEAADQNRAGHRDALPNPGLVLRIFSPEDREFVARTHSPRLQRIYLQERRKVALHWVQRTSQETGRIMRAHRLSSRHSQNLDAGAEANLFFQYLRLRFFCALLVILIQLFGPHALVELAKYACQLYQRIERVLPEGQFENSVTTAEESATH